MSPTPAARTAESRMLHMIRRDAFGYFLHETNRAHGLVADKTCQDWPASIAAVGLGLTAYAVGVERGFITRAEAAERTLSTLRFFRQSKQGPEPDATGYKGFYYHFLDMQTGARAWQCELSTVDSALLLAGMLAAAEYFGGGAPAEREIRELAHELYARVDWRSAQNGGVTVTHGWKPESGFLPHRWEGYDEALVLYVLGLGSPTHPLPAASYQAWASTYEWRTIYDTSYLHSGPLFTHQPSHLWLDLRGIQDAYGFKATFNLTFLDPGGSGKFWVSPWHFGLHSGPTVVMIENYASELIRRLMRSCPYIAAGLRAAGFNGGWLGGRP